MKQRGWIDGQIGCRFGYLVVIGTGRREGRQERLARVRCDCGTEKLVECHNLRRGASRSCGCMVSRTLAEKATVHGRTKHPEYPIWRLMVARCTDPSHPNYSRYGARGIHVCARWRSSFEAFLADMGPRPRGGEIERIDNDRGYEPGNCRWATRVEQMNNTRQNVVIEYDSRRLTVAQWARELGIKAATIRSRLARGHKPVRALATETFKGRRFDREGR